MSVHYHAYDKTVWPVDSDDDEKPSVEWSLRYNGGWLPKETLLSAASVMAAYRNLTDPTITETQAMAMLKRARKCAKLCFIAEWAGKVSDE